MLVRNLAKGQRLASRRNFRTMDSLRSCYETSTPGVVSITTRLFNSSYTRLKEEASSSVQECKTPESSSRSFLSSFSKEASIAPIDFNMEDRWKAVIPATMVHLSIGSVYAYSMWTPGMTTALGFVGSAPLDWTHSQVLPVFSAAAVTLGVTTSVLGSWVEKNGPRKAGAIGSLFWGSALCTAAAGVHLHSLPLVYLGYGMFGGIGWGLMYLAPGE